MNETTQGGKPPAPKLSTAMGFADHMTAGYRHAMHGGPDPVHTAARSLAKSDIQAELARLETHRRPDGLAAPIIQRDHVSRIKAGFLHRVMAVREELGLNQPMKATPYVRPVPKP